MGINRQKEENFPNNFSLIYRSEEYLVLIC